LLGIPSAAKDWCPEKSLRKCCEGKEQQLLVAQKGIHGLRITVRLLRDQNLAAPGPEVGPSRVALGRSAADQDQPP
jgi:hypothetical protein